MKIISTGRKIDQNLSYKTISFHREEIGRIPNDIFLQTEKTPPLDTLKKVRPVVVSQPEIVNGQPQVREVTKHFKASAPSAITGGVIGGFVGGVVGAIVGGWASIFTGNGAFLLGGGSLGLAAGSYLGASINGNKELQLVVQDRPILSKTMTGTKTTVTKGHLKGKSGYFHRFSGEIEATNHGSYQHAQIQTVKKDKA